MTGQGAAEVIRKPVTAELWSGGGSLHCCCHCCGVVVLWWVSCRVSTHTNYIPTTLPVHSIVYSVQSSSDTDFTGCLIFNEVKQLGAWTVDNVDNGARLHAGVLLGTLQRIVLVSLLHLNNYSTFPSSTQSRHRSSGQHDTGTQYHHGVAYH